MWVHDDRAGAVSPLVAVGADVPAADVARRWSRLPVRELGELADVLQHRTTIPWPTRPPGTSRRHSEPTSASPRAGSSRWLLTTKRWACSWWSRRRAT